jgi:hypothetical protein
MHGGLSKTLQTIQTLAIYTCSTAVIAYGAHDYNNLF